jgi:sugar transferase (PEP-CTERM/EpsH1 system associated)
MARPLYPADTGGKIRSSKIFEHLSRAHDVTIVCFRTTHDTPEQLDAMQRCCTRLVTVDWDEAPKFTPAFYRQLACSNLSPLPFTVWKYQSRGMQGVLRQLLREDLYDLLLCDFLQPSVNCLNLSFTPKVLFQHNVEAVIRMRHAQYAQGWVARAYLRREAAKLHAFEHRASHTFDHCVMVSDEDCRTMSREYGVTSTSAIPTGVDVQYFSPQPASSLEPVVVFVGSMDWLPNQDAATYFVSEVLPLIRREVPARFVIVGRNPPAAIRRLEADRHVHVTGTLADVRPPMAEAQVCVVPIRIGGGTRIKIFEAMAMGKAVVSTTVGAEGLPVTHGRDILIADDPPTFARHVIQLLKNPDSRVRLGAVARQLVEQRYSWHAAAERFCQICTDVVQQSRAQRA